MRAIKILFGTAALLAGLALAPAARAQIAIDIGVQPSCAYGYYGYAPYRCAPMGYYGPGYFYNGIFLGMGPWGGWGYSHGWGDRRFAGEGGGRYHGGPGRMAYRGNGTRDRGGQRRGYAAAPNSNGARPSGSHRESHAPASHAASSGGSRGGNGHDSGQARDSAGHQGGGQSHGGDGHGGGHGRH